MKSLKERKWKNILKIECLGVKIGVRSNNHSFLKKVKKNLSEILPISWLEVSHTEVEHWFSIIKGEDRPNAWTVFKDEAHLVKDSSKETAYDLIVTKIRATVAEFAREFVFLHAGAVSWRGKAIIIPGKSFSGKSTLVSELIKRNCDYLSDEFAVIDRNGFLHPFPKKISLRGIVDDYRQLDVDVEELGGKSASKPVPIGFLLVSEYKKKVVKPKIKINSSGEGVMASVANSISVRQNPKFVLETLSVIANKAIVLETKRGEAAEFADYFLDYLENLESSKKAEAV